MDVSKRKSLESAGWKIGDAADFLEMSDNEKQLLDQRLDLMAKSNIMNFYLDVKGNQNGDMREQILSWSNDALEVDHDYIQWLFPSNEISTMNFEAPVLTKKDANEFSSDSVLKDKLRLSFLRILNFFELELVGEKVQQINLDKIPIWLKEFNHNMFRVTRIIKSLRLLGLEKEALSFFEFLSNMKNNKNISSISENTFNHWKTAAKKEDLWM